MTQQQQDFLLDAAARYIWWMPPEESVRHKQKLLASIMNMGDDRDTAALLNLFSNEQLKEVLRLALIGQFSSRAWSFWHRMLYSDLTGAYVPPALPARRFNTGWHEMESL